jgi:hypothetical protein
MMPGVFGGFGGGRHRCGKHHRQKDSVGLHGQSRLKKACRPSFRSMHKCPVGGNYVAPRYGNLMYRTGKRL